MTILVTGGAGYIGSHMVLELLETDEDIIILDDLSTGFAHLIPSGVRFIEGDIGDKALLDQIIAEFHVDAIAHFAAKIVVPESVSDPLGYYLNNTSKARTLIAAAVEGGVKSFIFSSTAAVYGEAKTMPVTEETLPAPVSPYGRSKLMVEWILQDAAAAHGLNTMILRYFNVAGADPKGRSGQSTPKATHLIKTAVETAVGRRDKMAVYGTDYPTYDGSCVRDYIHVSDLARAHVLALNYLRNGGQGTILNCAYGHGSSVIDVIETVKKVSGLDFQVDIEGRRPGDPPEIVATGEKLRAVLGWEPQFDNLETIVGHALAWEKHLLKETNR